MGTEGLIPQLVFLIRPHAIQFLHEMAAVFEVVVFTAAEQSYADEVLDRLDPRGELISYRLYRQHTVQLQNVHTQ